MPRIEGLREDQVAPEVADMLQRAARRFGQPSPSSSIQAHCPPILEASRALGAAPARSGTLPARIRSLVCLRVAQLAGCPF